MTKRSKITLGLISLVSALYNITLPLHPDEAYYWVWSRNLQLSYFDHPPMVAYLIKLVTSLGTNEFAIRLVAVISTTIAAVVVYKLAEDMFGASTADKSLLIFLLLPIVHAGYIVVTPDSPLILFWALTLYFFYQYVFNDQKKSIYLAGLAGGCLLLSKYTGVLLFPALFLFVITAQEYDLLTDKRIYISLLLAAVVFMPVVIWNYNHDWASFRFQYSHGAAESNSFELARVGEFIGGQAGVFNPVFFFGLFYLLISNFKELLNSKKLEFLFWPFMFTLGFFMYYWSFKSGEVNWTAPAYITGPILLGYWIDKLDKQKLYKAGIVVSAILIILIRVPEVVPNFPKHGALKRKFMGYKQLFTQVDRYIDNKEIVLVDRYQLASEAQFYLSGRPTSYIAVDTRFSNYNYWSKEVKQKVKQGQVEQAVYITGNKNKKKLPEYFKQVKLEATLKYSGRYVDRELYLYKCRN